MKRYTTSPVGFFFSKIMKYNKIAINDKQEILHCNIMEWKTRNSGFKYMYDLKSEDLNFAGDGFWSFSDGQQRK